nr:MAG TPA: hypothetical protein [Crassvirales sp.]
MVLHIMFTCRILKLLLMVVTLLLNINPLN